MLPGIVIKPLKRFADERGFFTEIMREDWDVFQDEIVQANLSITYPGIVRRGTNMRGDRLTTSSALRELSRSAPTTMKLRS